MEYVVLLVIHAAILGFMVYHHLLNLLPDS